MHENPTARERTKQFPPWQLACAIKMMAATARGGWLWLPRWRASARQRLAVSKTKGVVFIEKQPAGRQAGQSPHTTATRRARGVAAQRRHTAHKARFRATCASPADVACARTENFHVRANPAAVACVRTKKFPDGEISCVFAHGGHGARADGAWFFALAAHMVAVALSAAQSVSESWGELDAI